MRVRPLLIPCIFAAVLTAAGGFAQTDAIPASTPPELEQARSRIAELEKEVARLQSALNDRPAPPADPAPVATEQPQAEISGPSMRFLDLGVRRDYIAAERNRLIDQLHTMIPPIYEPAFSPFHGYTLPQHAFRVGITSDRFTNDHDFGRDEQYALFFDNVKVENQHVDVDVAFGVTANDTARLIVPLHSTIISGTGHPFRIQPMTMTMNGTAFGLGDVQLMSKHKWLDQSYGPLDFATVAGIQFPTGKNDARFEDAQTLVMGGMSMPVSSTSGGPRIDLFSDDLRVPNSAQPGTGAWGGMAGLMATRQLTWTGLRGAIHGGVMYKAMAHTREGVRPGNELVVATSFVRPPIDSEHVTFDVTILARHKESERFPGTIMHPEAGANGMPLMNPDGSLKMFVTRRPPFEHGTVVFAAPSLVFIPKPSIRLSVSPLFRIHEPNEGPSPRFRLIFGATTTF